MTYGPRMQRKRRLAADDLYGHDMQTEIMQRRVRFPLRPRDGVAIQVGMEVNTAIRALSRHPIDEPSVQKVLLPALRVISQA